jgi:magnesium-transporting ATPase (P-type)
MMKQFNIFVLVLSIIFMIKLIIQFSSKLFQENPEPMKISKIEETLIYFAISYIITYILI